MTRARHDAMRARLARMCARLYDARTSARVRSDLSMKVAILRQKLGAMSIDQLTAASLVDAGEEA